MRQDPLGAATAAPLGLPSVPNFRDLGGIPTADGRRVAPGRIYRSPAFTALQEDEWTAVSGIGFRLVCDLRSNGERDKHPVRWVGEPPRFVELAVLPDVRTTGPDVMRRIVEDPTGEAARRLLLENYAAMPAAFAGSFRPFVDSIIDLRELPMLISCTAGQDRTGFVSALILLALGVSHDDVVADYLRSNEAFDPETVRRVMSASLDPPLDAPPADAVLDVLQANVEYLERALAVIDADYGCVDAYVESAGGLDERRRDELRAALLEPR